MLSAFMKDGEPSPREEPEPSGAGMTFEGDLADARVLPEAIDECGQVVIGRLA
jgi:hypothetical protein